MPNVRDFHDLSYLKDCLQNVINKQIDTGLMMKEGLTFLLLD